MVARTIWLKAGHFRVVLGRAVCARKAKPRMVTHTTTIAPSSIGQAKFVEFDNGSGATSGSSFIPAGTYRFEVTASAAWTLSF